MSYLLLENIAREMLKPITNNGANVFSVRLHTGNPTVTQNSNNAKENKEKTFKFNTLAELEGHMYELRNREALEWAEVGFAETYTWISIRQPEGFGGVINIELSAPVVVAVGDTFRINIGKLILKLLKE